VTVTGCPLLNARRVELYRSRAEVLAELTTLVAPSGKTGSRHGQGFYTGAVDNRRLLRRFYPDANIGGFGHVDGTISSCARMQLLPGS
jgi:hypothetical protein